MGRFLDYANPTAPASTRTSSTPTTTQAASGLLRPHAECDISGSKRAYIGTSDLVLDERF